VKSVTRIMLLESQSSAKNKAFWSKPFGIVAEVFAAVMCELHDVHGYHAHAWEYIKHYSDDDPVKALQAIFRVLSDVEECLNCVFKVKKKMDFKEIA